MFALLALVCFVLAAFGVSFGVVDLLALGLAFVAAHLILGLWPLEGRLTR
jgi:hypothetical protein